MEQRLAKLKNLFTSNSSTQTNTKNTLPQVGFKVTFCVTTKQLKVKVIGARLLPVNYGLTKPFGYLVKVRVFPEREKFETAILPETWPIFNEEFLFSLTSPKSGELLNGKFLSLTIYAVLENVAEASRAKPKNTLKRFFSFSEFGTNSKPFRKSFRHSLNSRRTIGAVTYYLDRKAFTQKTELNSISTLDIWRDIKDITSGIETVPREGKKGSVEVKLLYAISEDSKNDVVEISVTKFRCNLQTMQDHEKIGGQLYIKINAFEEEDVVQKMKSDKFNPTISLKIEHSTFRANVSKNMRNVKICIRLMCQSLLTKKTMLGKIEIVSSSEIWKEIIASPSKTITRMLNFE